MTLAGAALLPGCGAADPSEGGAWQDGELAADAQASSKWYCGTKCSGTDPASYAVNRGEVRHCADDAVTVSSTGPFYGRTLQLRYSNTCETVWARVWGGQFQDKIFLQEQIVPGWSDVLWWEMDDPSDPVEHNWSMQQDDHHVTIRACLGLVWAHSSILGCTGGY